MRIRLEKVAVPIAMLAIGLFYVAARMEAQGNAAQAPPSPPQRVAVTTTQVKPELLTTWQEIVRTELIPAQKKAGLTWRSTFANGPFGQGFTFVTVTPVSNFAQYDQGNPLLKALGQEGLNKYNAKIRPTIVSTHTTIETVIANASIQSFSSTPPAWARVQTLQLLPGKGQEFATITAQEFLPALKKAGVTDYIVLVPNYGAPNNQRTIVTYFNKFAELDGPNPLQRALGQEAAQKLNQKRNALVATSEATVFRYVADLSFGAPTKPTTSQ